MTHQSLGWGILGAGSIAHKFADAVNTTAHCHLVAVASKDPSKATLFAQQHQISAADDYLALVRRPDIDIIYVATTHNFHYQNARLALENGKHVLLEKPFTVNAKEALLLIELAKERNLFLMEALWVRFLPSMQKVRSILRSGILGEIKLFNVSFGGFAPPQYLPRLVDPNLAGGVTLDMGIYPITFINFLLDELPQSSKSFARMSDRGVDEIATYQFQYPSGCLATVATSFNLLTKQEAMIYGSKGYIEFPQFQEGAKFTVHIHNGTRTIETSELIETDKHPNGFIYQIEEVVRCIHAGELESSTISHAETLATMTLMDGLRAEWNFRYPFE